MRCSDIFHEIAELNYSTVLRTIQNKKICSLHAYQLRWLSSNHQDLPEPIRQIYMDCHNWVRKIEWYFHQRENVLSGKRYKVFPVV